MQMQITALYAAVLGLILVVLSAMVIAMRAQTKIALNDGGNIQLAERIRRHGNFIEYVPMALILMGLAEAGGASTVLIHVAGVILVASRLLHPLGIRHDKADALPRVIGGSGTLIAILLCAGAILWHHLGN
jgi:uncharacterized membrane protein YecN with MAPEG domain